MEIGLAPFILIFAPWKQLTREREVQADSAEFALNIKWVRKWRNKCKSRDFKLVERSQKGFLKVSWEFYGDCNLLTENLNVCAEIWMFRYIFYVKL